MLVECLEQISTVLYAYGDSFTQRRNEKMQRRKALPRGLDAFFAS